jgi:hypothetical protein
MSVLALVAEVRALRARLAESAPEDLCRAPDDQLVAEAIKRLGQPPAAAPTAEQLQPTDQEGDRD